MQGLLQMQINADVQPAEHLVLMQTADTHFLPARAKISRLLSTVAPLTLTLNMRAAVVVHQTSEKWKRNRYMRPGVMLLMV